MSSPVSIFIYGSQLEYIDRHDHRSKQDPVRVTVRENVAAGPWIIALAGLASSNIPLTS